MNTIVQDVLMEQVGNPMQIDPKECRKIIGRMFCELKPSCMQAAETFTPHNWEHTLFECDENPIRNDDDLVEQIKKGLDSEQLPYTDEGVVKLLAIWIFS